MPRYTCEYCTLRDQGDARNWIVLEQDSERTRFCSFSCLSDWTAEREGELETRATA